MPKSIQELRERRKALVDETRNVMDQHPGETWGDEQQKTYDQNTASIHRLDEQIKREQEILDLDADKAFQIQEASGDQGLQDAPDVNGIFANWLRGGDKAVTPEQWQNIRNTMSGNPDVNPEQGGYTVDKKLSNKLLEALDNYGGLRPVATVERTSNGADISYPTTDGTTEEGELVPENQPATDEDVTFGTKKVGAYKFSSKVVTVPFELMQDSSYDIAGVVNRRLEQRLARINNRLFTVGTGTAQPEGIVTAAAVGKAGAVSATPIITYDDLVDLEHSVNSAYRFNAGFMLSDKTLALLRKVKDNNGRPVFVPGYEHNVPGGAPSTLLGHRITINDHMDDAAASAKSILFGDFSHYLIRDVMAVTYFRFTDSAYTKRGQVGFMAWMRTDGKLLDVGGAVKAFQHGAAA